MPNLIHGDCVNILQQQPDAIFDLAFVDPPFNIGYKYDKYNDNLSTIEYMKWCRTWANEVIRVLKPSGSLWLAIGDEYASDLDVLFRRELGLIRRNWVIWYYTFGVNCTNKFTPSHTHLLYYVRDQNNFTYNGPAIKVPSARQMIYNDKRAKSGGRLPDDVWIVRPGSEMFPPESDVWKESRICGTFKERVDHPCQMPEAILERIIKASTNEYDMILDPMAGSGTTLVVAEKLKRNWFGIELSDKYINLIKNRLSLLKPEACSN